MPKERKEVYQETMVELRKFIEELPNIIRTHPEEKRFQELVKEVRNLAAMVEVIAGELQRGAKYSP
ncbi:hypothetical protein ES702_07854 [subsurface metagenome]